MYCARTELERTLISGMIEPSGWFIIVLQAELSLVRRPNVKVGL
jgi:hypothetical protein